MTTTPPPPGPAYAQPTPLSPSDERLYSTLIHIGGIFFGFLPSLIGYLVFKDRGPFVNAHSKTALNFQITMTIASFAGAVLSLVIIGWFLIMAVAIVLVVFSIIAAVAANKGEFYTYPLTIAFIR